MAKIIYKRGDDLRQDQLVCQFIRIIDRFWKHEGLDLRLTPYRVLATDHDEGIVQMVPNAKSLSKITKWGIREYLREQNASDAPDAVGGVSAQAMDAYVRSCAGYCIITYILGIGDRHLDNILMCPDGRLLHIDFGFMFGRDPKPFPPAMKISRDMLQAMGGPKSPHYARFVEHCWSGYRIVRAHADFLLNLLALMNDSCLPCLNIEACRENFMLHLDDRAAKQHLLDVILKSVSAFVPEIMDRIHEMAMMW
jgi:phosphatidylinositol 3-kinase